MLLRAIAFVVGRLPSRGRAAVAWLVAFVFGAVLRHRRSHVEAAMRRAGLPDPKRHAARMYEQLARSVIELLTISSVSRHDRDAWITDRVESPDEALIARAMSQRHPVVILASHTGNWELAAAAAAKKWVADRGLHLVAKPLHSRMFDRFTRRLREELFGLRTIAPAGALRGAARALREGGVVVMPIDQAPDELSGRRNAGPLVTSFLGADALVDRAPATLAWRTRATILVIAATRDPHRVCVIEHIEPPAPNNITAREWIDDTTRRATRALERFVRAHPEGWLWLHRRWKMPRSATGASARRLIHLDAQGPAGGASACRRAPG